MLRIAHADIFSLDTWGVLFPVLAWIGSVFTFIYSMKLFSERSAARANLLSLKRRRMKHRSAC